MDDEAKGFEKAECSDQDHRANKHKSRPFPSSDSSSDFMDNEPAGAVHLPQELESWTRELVTVITGNDAALELSPHSLLARIAAVRALLSVMRRRAASRSQLLQVPAQVLEHICQYLTVAERIALSHVSSGIRDRLTSLPRVWSDIDINYLRRSYISADMLQTLAARSVDKRVLLNVTLCDRNVLTCLPIVALNLHRMCSLSLSILTELDVLHASTSDPAFWKATLDALLVPAPRLERLSLSVLRRIRWIPMDMFYGPLRVLLPLSSSIFAGQAPLLRTLQLGGIHLPKVSCSAFSNIVFFHFERMGIMDTDEIALAAALMPQLHTLILEALNISARHPQSSSGSLASPSSLRNLLLIVENLNPENLCGVIDFQLLRYLDVINAVETAELIALAYPASSIKKLVMAYTGNVLEAEDDSGTARTTIRIYPHLDTHDVYLFVTWLAVHEFCWPGSGEWDVLPEMPAVVTLRIWLATCDDSLQAADSTSILAHNPPDSAWHLPALRDLCITAPSTCVTGTPHCTCLGSRSVALSDVARFVRLGMRFNAPRLEELRLAGLRIIDTDFCSAWEEMSACAKVIELLEQPEVIPHMDLDFPWDYDVETYFQNRESVNYAH